MQTPQIAPGAVEPGQQAPLSMRSRRIERLSTWLKRTLAAVPLLLVACGGGGGGDGSGGAAPVAAFSLTVAPASLTVGQGQEGVVEVNLQRDAGFTDPVRVTLNPPGAGITADTLVLSGSQARGVLQIRVSQELAAGSVHKLDVTGTVTGTGTGAGASRVASGTLLVSAPQASTQANIAAALAAGTLDLETALLYRVYARWGDKRLPGPFVGAHSAEEDSGLFDEVRLRLASLSAGAQEALRPFIVRPADPRSVWNASASASGSASPARANLARKTRAAASPSACPIAPQSGLSWISKRSASHPLRVWAQCRGEPGHDAESVALVDKTLALLNKIYTPMTGVMRVPRPDVEGDDDAIDVYIVDDGSYVYRAEQNVRPVKLATAFAECPESTVVNGCSGFITLVRSLPYNNRFNITLIHEFFHVLQYAYNGKFSMRPDAGKPDQPEHHWFMEASASWAAAYFDRTLAPWDDGRAAYVDVHRMFKQYFQPSFDALNASGGAHAYSAYIWPYFVEQETSGPAFMKKIWIGLEGVGTFEAADKAIDTVYPFAANFKRFALRNINAELLPGDPLPSNKRHVKLDPDQFVDDKKEPPYLTGTLAANQEYSQDFNLMNLSARYVRLTVAEASPAIRKVVVDISGLQPASELDVQALVRTDDGWLALEEPIEIKPDKVTFCFDKGPTTASLRGSFKEILLVLSNHATPKGTNVSGTLKVQPKSVPCGTLWEGTISQVVRNATALSTSTLTSNSNVSFEFDDTAIGQPGEVRFRLKSGSWTYDGLNDIFGRNPACRGIIKGAGALPLGAYQPLVPSGTSASLSIFPATGQFHGGGLSVVQISTTDNCNDRNVDVTTVDPTYTHFWWNEQNPNGELSADGNSIRRTYRTTVPNDVSYDIRLDKKTE